VTATSILRTLRTNLIASLGIMALIFQCASQTRNLPFQEKEDARHAISILANCVASYSPACIAKSISVRGVTLGVDGPRVSRAALVKKLQTDRPTQCLFWGTHCDASNGCSVLGAVSETDKLSIAKPRMYEKRWQLDVEPGAQGPCRGTMPFVFQLEDGYWKLVAIPYT
jgi:hypothetical protein